MKVAKGLARGLGYVAALVSGTMSAAAEISNPLIFSNGKAAPWALVERDGDEWCVIRSPIKGNAPFNFATLSPSLGKGFISLSLVGPSTGQPSGPFEIAYQIDESKVAKTAGYVGDNGAHRTVGFGLRDAEANRLYEGASIAFAPNGNAAYLVDTSRFMSRLVAWEACQRKRLVALGADPGMVDKVAKLPEGQIVSFFNADDYPSAALKADKQGTVEVLAIVDKEGRVRKCVVIQSSKSEDLDRATCSVLKSRARFKPGLDRDGHPVEAPISSVVRWKLPD